MFEKVDIILKGYLLFFLDMTNYSPEDSKLKKTF